MKKVLLTAFSLLLLSVATAASSLSLVSAYECGYSTDASGKKIPVTTAIDFTMGGTFSKLCTSEGASPVSALILWTISFMAVGVGIAVVIGIIFGGISYTMSDGDAGKAKEGQGIIVNAVIGLFLFIFMYAAANFLIPGGLFK